MRDAAAGPLVLLAAGGTGGHLFPAEALSIALARRGAAVELATDERATHYGRAFPARATHIIPSATLRGRDPWSLVKTGSVLTLGVIKAWRLFGRIRPAVVVGFGGYPSIPPVLAASLRGLATVIHEQNSVMGRANRFLAPRVTAIATGFPGVLDRDPALAGKTHYVGNPLRPAVLAAAGIAFAAPQPAGRLRLLVFGGSQGAHIMAEVVPAAIEALAPPVRARLDITQQARAEDADHVRSAYARLGLPAQVEPFFIDLPDRIGASHLVISRSGASTVAELAAIGRPAILVPLPHSLDQDQRANAGVLAQAGGAIRMLQDEFTPAHLASAIASLINTPERLTAMAAAAKTVGSVDAADRLADLVLQVVKT